MITLNLDFRQFAQDVIEGCEGPDLLRALWHAIEKVTILDPTCGSGAFLFAAVNVLEPLYEACLDRMEVFVNDLEQSKQNHSPERYSDFRRILTRVAEHPNRRYFIFKSIILANLYGVDIMEEAVEICKLRLFLKLASQIEPDPDRDNFGIEPLPDIDFNIKAGNTLVGFSTFEDVKRVVTSKLDFDNSMENIFLRAIEVQQSFDAFRDRQVEGDGGVPTEVKAELRKRLADLQTELDRYLADEYGLDEGNFKKKADYLEALATWRKSHQPFHWFLAFNGIMLDGGFDVIIGNPPYVELKALTDYRLVGYKCEDAGNLYAVVMERCDSLGKANGRQGYIVPVSSVSTDRYLPLQKMLLRRNDWFSSYDDRPSRLFDGLEHIRLAIHILGAKSGSHLHYSTKYKKWSSDERQTLFQRLIFASSQPEIIDGTLPKLSSTIERSLIAKLMADGLRMALFYKKNGNYRVYFSRKVGYFLQVLDFEPQVLDGEGNRRPPSEFKEILFEYEDHAEAALGCLNSSLFYWFITVFSDCRHLNKREVDAFPVDLKRLSSSLSKPNSRHLTSSLMKDLQINSINKVMSFKHDTLTVQCIYPKNSKSILDNLDCVLAQHYGFTEGELDFVINYDFRFRMGRDSENDES